MFGWEIFVRRASKCRISGFPWIYYDSPRCFGQQPEQREERVIVRANKWIKSATFRLILPTAILSALLAPRPGVAAGFPPSAALTYTEPSPDGIPYRWHIDASSFSVTSFKYYVGAKSWWEPTNPAATPGWTHTSNWIALHLEKNSLIDISIVPLGSIACTGSLSVACASTKVAGSDLYPGLSLYAGIDTTSDQDHVFNPIGNFWSSINYIDSKRTKGPKSLTYSRYLTAGDYTIDVGGANAFFCKSTDPCYTGGEGYSTTLTVLPVGR